MFDTGWQPRLKRKVSVLHYGMLDVYPSLLHDFCPICNKESVKTLREDVVEKLPEIYYDSYCKCRTYKWMPLILYECAACGYLFLIETGIIGPYSDEVMKDELKIG